MVDSASQGTGTISEPDTELLRCYAEERSEAAFAALVRRHLDLVYSAAQRRLGGDAHAAADVAQQVFTALARKAESLTHGVVLPAWLYATTRNVAVDFIRAEQRRRAREHEASTMHPLFSATPDADWEKLRPVLDDAMDDLNDTDRAAVLMRFFQQRAFAEIGAALRLSEDAARMRVERALQKLHALLARRGVTSTSSALAVALANQAVAVAPAHLAATVTSGAFAGAAVGGSAALASGAITFMSTSKLAVGIAAIIVAVGIGSAIYEANLATQAAAESAALRQTNGAMAAKSADLEAKLRAAEASGEAASVRVAALEKDLAQAKQNPANAAPRPAIVSASSTGAVWANPVYARAYLEKYRASLGLRYGPLYRTLNLSPEQIAKFEAALTEAQQATIDIWAAAGSQGIATSGNSAASTAVSRMTVTPAAAMQEALKASIGEAGLAAYQQFDRTKFARDLVANLAGNVYYSEAPLTAQQGEALAEILTSHTKVVKTPMASDGKSPMFLQSNVTDWDAVNAQAQMVLSLTQAAALRSLVEQERSDSEMRQAQRTPAVVPGKQPGG